MHREKIDSGVERQILIAMIMSKEFLGQAYPIFELKLVEARHFKRIAKWCLDYYRQYKKAPQKDIESIYRGWIESVDPSEDQIEATHDFLDRLSSQYEKQYDINIPYMLDELSRFMARRKLSVLQESLAYHLSEGDSEEAERAVLEYKSVDAGASTGTDLLNDDKAWTDAFAEKEQPIIEFSGDAGKFFNSALTRDALIAIQAPEKRGKTWMCIELALRALRQRRKVAFFEVGDLSESQTTKRFGVRFASRPLRKNQCGVIQIPKSIQFFDGDDDEEDLPENVRKAGCDVIYDYVTREKHLTLNSTIAGRRRFLKTCGLSEKNPYLMASTHPNSSINIRGIEGILDRWKLEKEFVPDVIIIDYADILAPEDSTKQARDQINDTWKAMRRMSQEKHCLVIAPTQANAASYGSDVQSMQNFSEDKRKMAHVTGMMGLNQNHHEKDIGVMRLNWIVLRESPFNTSNCLYIGQCMTLGRAITCATFRHKAG